MKLWKLSRSEKISFVRDIDGGKLHFVSMSPSLYRGEKEDFKFLETITDWECSNLHNNLTPVDSAFPGSLTKLLQPPHPPPSPLFNWRWCLRWWLGPFWRVAQSSWFSPMHTGGAQASKLLVVFLLWYCLLLQCLLLSAKNLPRRIEVHSFPSPPLWSQAQMSTEN